MKLAATEINAIRREALIADMALTKNQPVTYLTDRQLKTSLFKTHLDRLEELAEEELNFKNK